MPATQVHFDRTNSTFDADSVLCIGVPLLLSRELMMERVYLEVPVFSQSSADSVIHADHGTIRLELNAEGSYGQGGTTPAPSTYRHAVVGNHHQTPLRVMIRPRGPPDDGSPDFVYSQAEFDAMVEAIGDWLSSGIMDEKRGDGFVFGALWSTGKEGRRSGGQMGVDVYMNSHLVNIAAPYPCVFHRAFVSSLSMHLGPCSRKRGLSNDPVEDRPAPTYQLDSRAFVLCGRIDCTTIHEPALVLCTYPVFKPTCLYQVDTQV